LQIQNSLHSNWPCAFATRPWILTPCPRSWVWNRPTPFAPASCASRSSASPASVHAESYWLGTLDPTAWLADIWPGIASSDSAPRKPAKTIAWQSLGSALDMTARVLVRSHAALFERIRAEGGQVCLLVTLSPIAVDSFSVAPEVSQIFGQLGITIEFEMMTE
jgi:hypothetical protein